jgi:hypothetical protein
VDGFERRLSPVVDAVNAGKSYCCKEMKIAFAAAAKMGT